MMRNLEAAQTGDRRRALEVARDTLAEAIDRAVAANAGTVAQLVAQYRNTLADIAALDGDDEEESKLDAIVLKLADDGSSRGGAAADSSRAAGRRKPKTG